MNNEESQERMAKPHHGFADLRILIPLTMALLCFDSHWVESKFFLRVQAARVVLGEWASCVLSNNNVQELKKRRDSGFQGLRTELRSSQASFGTMC